MRAPSGKGRGSASQTLRFVGQGSSPCSNSASLVLARCSSRRACAHSVRLMPGLTLRSLMTRARLAIVRARRAKRISGCSRFSRSAAGKTGTRIDFGRAISSAGFMSFSFRTTQNFESSRAF